MKGWIAVAGVAFLVAGCGTDPDPDGEAAPGGTGAMGPAETVEVRGEVDPDSPLADVRLVRSPDVGPSYPNARIGIAEPEAGARFEEGEAVEVRLSLTAFELRTPTEEGDERGIARADDGQHIHLIVNDRPYDAIYEIDDPIVLDDLSEGTHVIRAFPGRDWHESVKVPGALAQRLIVVGDGDPAYPAPEEWGPTLIYSRPQGEYEGEMADSVLVDFVLGSVRLEPEGHRVRITLNETREFVVSEWAPYLLVGLPAGEHTLRLELLSPQGTPVQMPFHPIEREFTIRR